MSNLFSDLIVRRYDIVPHNLAFVVFADARAQLAKHLERLLLELVCLEVVRQQQFVPVLKRAVLGIIKS